ncbi:hypothetical protein L5515_010883 [Caenorhabditis briggsae]|uniref:Uncharacterized protein n=1 Tax=Caenorhabditis briggsae TaxID=6238 RepID=A0AAE9ENC2_CAEBR|nr:hypothetical protein L5515_010883 [Caenorhabditis briggsae]
MPLPDFSVWNYSRRFGSVEMKVAAALADKEGCAAKRKLAIEQEAERKRLKMMEKQKIGKEIAVPAAISTRQRDVPPRPSVRSQGPPVRPAGPPVRSVHFRSIGCQVKPKDIPNLCKFAMSETESQYTGVHYKGDYALLREQIPIPQILPHEELAPIERQANCLVQKPKTTTIGKLKKTADSPQLPSLDGPFEEKYVGPLLNGAVPEMIVSSGSLGMTDTRPKQQIIRQRKRPSEKEALLEDPDWAFDDSSQPSTSSSHQKKLKSMNATSQLSQEPDDYTPNPGAHWESFGSSISSEKDLRRYREIGRIISEITLSDFPSDKGDRKARSISSRGEEILAAVKRNLNVVREKLESFAQATPQRVDRLSQMVAEKLQRNKMGEDPQPFHLAPDASITEKEVKLEEVEVKLEEPEYTDNCNF